MFDVSILDNLPPGVVDSHQSGSYKGVGSIPTQSFRKEEPSTALLVKGITLLKTSGYKAKSSICVRNLPIYFSLFQFPSLLLSAYCPMEFKQIVLLTVLFLGGLGDAPHSISTQLIFLPAFGVISLSDFSPSVCQFPSLRGVWQSGIVGSYSRQEVES